MIALDPLTFGLGVPNHRALELGAGTGLLSLVWKGMSERLGAPSEVFATDYHEAVLDNLKRNVEANSAAITPAASPSGSRANSPYINPADSSTNVSSLASSSSSLPVQAHKLDWSAVHSTRAFAAASSRGQPVAVSMPPPFDRPFHTLLAADVVYGPEHAEWLKSCVEQFLVKPDSPEAQDSTVAPEASGAVPTSAIASLSLEDTQDKAVPIPTRPALHSTESTAVADAAPSHTAKTTTSSDSDGGPGVDAAREGRYRPAFHLIVPLRPTHVEAIASINKVFPMREDLPPRKEGEPWRVAVESVTEIERVKGVGRADEENYRLLRIGFV